MENTIRVGLGLYIFNEKNEILLGLRKSKHAGGTWCPPGGHLEYGESFEQCAARETLEEAGLTVNEKDIRLMTATSDFYTDNGRHYVTLHMATRVFKGTPKVMEPDKCERWEWFALDKIPGPMLVSAQNLLKTGALQKFIAFCE